MTNETAPSGLAAIFRPQPGDLLPYWLGRLLWITKAIGDVPWLARPRWLLNALTYRCEICFECGRRVGRCTGSWWRASDHLWIEVVGEPHGVLCPPCFTAAAEAKGISVAWGAHVDHRAAAGAGS